MSFGQTLRQVREELGWTQPQLARAMYDASGGTVDLTANELSRYEREKVRNPRLDVIRAAAAATGRPVDVFTSNGREPRLGDDKEGDLRDRLAR